MSSRPLKVLVVAEDRAILRQLSKSLHAFGYNVQQVADRQHAVALLADEPPDMLIVDAAASARAALDVVRAAVGQDRSQYVYVCLLIERAGPQELKEALEAGVDDFLAKPVVYGELLARLRAGTRVLEFERRYREQTGIDPLTGLISRNVLVDRLQAELSLSATTGRPVSCALVEIDFFERIRRVHGRAAAESVRRAAGDRLRRLAAPSIAPTAAPADGEAADGIPQGEPGPEPDTRSRAAAVADPDAFWAEKPVSSGTHSGKVSQLPESPEGVPAALGDGRFCVLLPGLSEDKAVAWAEEARRLLAETELPAEDAAVRPTASFGVAAFAGTSTGQPPAAQDVLDQAGLALRAAQSSGGNCVVRHGQFDDDARAWAEFAAPGKLFERTHARDVMTPCTLVLRPDLPVGMAGELFRQTRLGALPVADEEGKLLGLVLAESVFHAPGGELSTLKVGEVMTTDVPVYEEDAGFTTLRDFFTRDSRPIIVVVSGGRPTGLVTPNVLAALTTPIRSDSFAPQGDFSAGSDYLLVPDLAPLDQL